MTVAAQAALADGRRAEWHDDLEVYRVINADGSQATERPYDSFEQGQKAERAARVTTVTNDAVQRDRLRAALPKLATAIGEVDTIAANTTGNTRTLATHLATSLRANRALAKLLTGELDTAD